VLGRGDENLQDRVVIDRIAEFDPKSIPTSAPSPSPTPFPSPAPKGLFDPKAAGFCAGDVPYSLVAWRTIGELNLPLERDGQIWAAVTAGEEQEGEQRDRDRSRGDRHQMPSRRSF